MSIRGLQKGLHKVLEAAKYAMVYINLFEN